MLLNMSVSGIPFVGADIGGYSGNPSPELFGRWMQAGALMPLFRPHSEKESIDKEPWKFGAEIEKISREAVELRYIFLPYLYSLFREHEQTGQPVMRPLWFEYSKDYKSYLIEDQFLLGRDLMVAPVVREGQRQRSVYFPVGDDWRNWWTGEIHKGGTSAQIDAPLGTLPVFARVGSVIPTQPVVQHTGEMHNVPLTLNVIVGISPERVEKAEIWQDSGDGFGYKLNEWRQISVEHKPGMIRLTRFGSYNGQKIAFIEALGVSKQPSEMRIDGKIVEKIEIDTAKQRLKISLGENASEITMKR
jgi:alpha-glucosidase